MWHVRDDGDDRDLAVQEYFMHSVKLTIEGAFRMDRHNEHNTRWIAHLISKRRHRIS
jgi:hypothetical protein